MIRSTPYENQLFTSFFNHTCTITCARFSPIQNEDAVKKELDFLISTHDEVGFSYQGTTGQLNDLILPLSYYSTADYWGEYVGNLPGNDLTVLDIYNSDYTLTPSKDSPGADLQIERVNVFNGTDIYDAACWQIALGLCARANISSQDLFSLAENQDILLNVGYDGNGSQAQNDANRALTLSNGTFTYNGEKINVAHQAYFFRMITRNWLSTDPFLNTSYMQWVKAENLPPNPEYQTGKITWLDWKPITGENAWGFLIGPLQTAYLKQQSVGGKYVPFTSKAVQNALGVLFAIRCMQSEVGGIYYACAGSLGNQGEQPVDPYEVSVENNASALAGLLIFQQILKDELAFEEDLSADQQQEINEALANINTLLEGGQTPQGKTTKGLFSFFQHEAWDSTAGIFYQGGDANNPQLSSDWVPTSEPKAVDVSTWGISVLGQPRIDQWYGFGAAFTMWQNVKSWGGYYGPDHTLWGVGYSDKDGNGSSGNYQEGIISAEWTAGAINMVRCLISQYQEVVKSEEASEEERKLAANYVAQLQIDHDSMYRNILTLRNDLYPSTEAYETVIPKNYTSLIPIPEDKLAFIYANKRYMIPFGWFANPLPSTTSTSWVIMLHYNFNPFILGGKYTFTAKP